MTPIDRTGASDAEFQARIAPFEGASFPAEVLLSHLESVRAALASPAPAPQDDDTMDEAAAVQYGAAFVESLERGR